MANIIDIDRIIELQQDYRKIKSEKVVSITISESTHKKLRNICWLIHENNKPRLSLVTSNIIENFIDDNREAILKIQSKKNITF